MRIFVAIFTCRPKFKWTKQRTIQSVRCLEMRSSQKYTSRNNKKITKSHWRIEIKIFYYYYFWFHAPHTHHHKLIIKDRCSVERHIYCFIKIDSRCCPHAFPPPTNTRIQLANLFGKIDQLRLNHINESHPGFGEPASSVKCWSLRRVESTLN